MSEEEKRFFNRYNITDEEDLKISAEKMSTPISGESQKLYDELTVTK